MRVPRSDSVPAAIKLGCIADDFTGATDLSNNLVRAGMRVVQIIGIPDGPVPDADAVVIALKSRTIEASSAVRQSLQAFEWLHAAGCRQFYFKVCSTFDSTPAGNIGPVAEALLQRLGTDFCYVTPAFPENARTVYKGNLFVGDVPLDESGMKNHPLTPMTDANLVRVMQAQCQGKVALLDHAYVRKGSGAIAGRASQLRAEGVRFAIVDAIDDADLIALGKAIAAAPLIVAGSGVAIGLPQNHGLRPSPEAAELPPARGARAVVSGSCSIATNRQVGDFRARGLPTFAVDPFDIAQGKDVAGRALEWAASHLGREPILIYSSATPDTVQRVQELLGVGDAGSVVEHTLAAIARGLVSHGVGSLVVAGGETSGACVQALGVRQMQIGPQIDPGVPWCYAHAAACDTSVHLALKSGNFGTPDFFTKAFDRLA